MSFRTDNEDYEAWLATQCDVVKSDIDYKHKRMKKTAFIFLRATYFRWARKIGDWCPELMDAPRVLSVGDLHLENFGTWRDADGRLVWGVNDFDEAAVMPYVLDLVRLATSIQLAPDRRIGNRRAAAALLRGYRNGLDDPQPALLFEGETWLRSYAEPTEAKVEKFWKEIAGYRKSSPPPAVAKALVVSLPKGVDRKTRPAVQRSPQGRRQPGAAALPRGRLLARRPGAARGQGAGAVGMDLGPRIRKASQKSHFLDLANGRYRAPDPFLLVRKKFIFRRVAADSTKIELGDDAGGRLHLNLMQAMGFDIASIHAAGTASVTALKADLRKRPPGWLNTAATVAAEAVKRDFRQWRD